MDTLRVKIAYRPLRICWVIASGDFAGFRKALRFNFTLWGGRYNPVVMADRPEDATAILEGFRADIVSPVGDSPVVRAFADRYGHLINPFFHDALYLGGPNEPPRAQLLDIHNQLMHLQDTPAWDRIIGRGVRWYEWRAEDPLHDLLLLHLGGYPAAPDCPIDYRAIVEAFIHPETISLEPGDPIPGDIFEHLSVSYFARHGLESHSSRAGWDFAGFYLGDVSNLDDLVACWNLRAADIPLQFVDPNHLHRVANVIPAWSALVQDLVSRRRMERERQLAVWCRPPETAQGHEEQAEELRRIFGEGPKTICHLHPHLWHSSSVQAPMMIFAETAQLGVLGTQSGKPRLSFALADKPFDGDMWFHTQHLVASLSFIGGLYGDDFHTLSPPYVPELNDFYGRTLHFEYNKFRVEPESFGLVIDAVDTDAIVYALPVAELFERIFKLAGLTATLSGGGLIARQLVAQVHGLRGAAVFKIPGVRRLLKTFGPTEPFTEKAALSLIGGKDEDNPSASFTDYEDLYIEARQIGTKLTPPDVFAYLVEKGLFRMGAQLLCPHCVMTSWFALDGLTKQQVICEMCGRGFDATRQLVRNPWYYRRSGILGAERNSQGAVPVTLTLQQLEANLGHGFREHLYSTSLDLKPTATSPTPSNGLPTCEVDFVWLTAGNNRTRTTIILGECKDSGQGKDGDGGTITAKDVENLRAVADALPRDRFETYILLAKLCPFTPQEIAAARTLNAKFQRRVILLEPWHIYDRRKNELGRDYYAGDPERLAMITEQLYFMERKAPPTASQTQSS